MQIYFFKKIIYFYQDYRFSCDIYIISDYFEEVTVKKCGKKPLQIAEAFIFSFV